MADRRGQARCAALAARQRRAARPIGCRSPAAAAGSSRARRRAALPRSRPVGASLMRAMFSRTVPANSSTSAAGIPLRAESLRSHLQIGAIEADVAGARREDAGEQAAQRGLAGARGPITPSASPAASSNVTPLRIGGRGCRREDHALDAYPPFGAGSLSSGRARARARQQRVEPCMAGERPTAPPGADRLLDRGERAGDRIEPAIMPPAVSSPSSTRYAPRPRMAI